MLVVGVIAAPLMVTEAADRSPTVTTVRLTVSPTVANAPWRVLSDETVIEEISGPVESMVTLEESVVADAVDDRPRMSINEIDTDATPSGASSGTTSSKSVEVKPDVVASRIRSAITTEGVVSPRLEQVVTRMVSLASIETSMSVVDDETILEISTASRHVNGVLAQKTFGEQDSWNDKLSGIDLTVNVTLLLATPISVVHNFAVRVALRTMPPRNPEAMVDVQVQPTVEQEHESGIF